MNLEHEDLMYLARRVARSVRRRDKLVEDGTSAENLVLRREERILADRKKRLGLLVESARVTDGLPPKTDLLGAMGRFIGDMTEERAEDAIAAGVLLETAYPDDEPAGVQPHNSITARPPGRCQLGQ